MMRRLLLLLLLPAFASAQVAVDGEANLSAVITTTDPWDIQDKTTAGSDRCVVLRFEMLSSTTLVGVTYGGVAMTAAGAPLTVTAGATRILHAYVLANPPTAATDIAIDFDGATTGSYLVSSYTGCDQADPVGDYDSATGTSTSATVTLSAATNDLVLDWAQVAGTITEGAGQTLEVADINRSVYFMGASREAGAASVTMSWSHASTAWGIIALSLNQASAGGSIIPKTRGLTQVPFKRTLQ